MYRHLDQNHHHQHHGYHHRRCHSHISHNRRNQHHRHRHRHPYHHNHNHNHHHHHSISRARNGDRYSRQCDQDGSTGDQKFPSCRQIGDKFKINDIVEDVGQIATKTCELATKFLVLSRQKPLDFIFNFEP